MSSDISIHALREEGDLSVLRPTRHLQIISIHALREEGDEMLAEVVMGMEQFLSTPSARRATPAPANFFRISLFLSTPSARRATCCERLVQDHRGYFYPRPPRGGRRDAVQIVHICAVKHFYPRPPRGGRPFPILIAPSFFLHFYPRPPRGGRPVSKRWIWNLLNFYPRPPRGGRPAGAMQMTAVNEFLSTPSARRATHSPQCGSGCKRYFYPRPPRGGRLL